MILKEEITLKSFYRVIEFVKKLKGVKMDHEKYKKIIFDQIQIESNEEKQIKNFSDSYLYLLNNTNQNLSYDLLENSYYLLSHKKLKKKHCEEILKHYYQNKDDISYLIASKLHILIQNIIHFNKIEFAFMITNFVLIQKGRAAVIPKFSNKTYKEYLQNNDSNALSKLFSQNGRIINVELNTNTISKVEIIRKIRGLKNLLIKQYGVKQLYLYGSYAKQNENTQSDIDILIQFNLSIDEKEKKIAAIQETIQRLLGKKIDLIDFDEAFALLDLNELSHTIPIL